MFSAPHTCQASALARIPAEPRYWMENLPVGHGRYSLVILTFSLLGFTWSGSSNAQTVVHTAQMALINVINMAMFILIYNHSDSLSQVLAMLGQLYILLRWL